MCTLELESPPELRILMGQRPISPEAVDRLMFAHGRQPGAWIGRDAVPRPLAQRIDERLLRKVLGEVEVVRHPRQRCNDAWELHPEDGLGYGGGRIGNRHAPIQPPPSALAGQPRTGRTRTSPSPSTPRKRFDHSTASARSRHSIKAQPPTISFASTNGPSTTV